jgi:bifunctional non-homologous end joining protein LigD
MQLKGGAQWTITTAREYVSFEKVDPWQGYWANRQTLDFAMEPLGYKAKKAPSVRSPRRSSPERGSHLRR